MAHHSRISAAFCKQMLGVCPPVTAPLEALLLSPLPTATLLQQQFCAFCDDEQLFAWLAVPLLFLVLQFLFCVCLLACLIDLSLAAAFFDLLTCNDKCIKKQLEPSATSQLRVQFKCMVQPSWIDPVQHLCYAPSFDSFSWVNARCCVVVTK
jgi:hypothetical protein